MHLSTMEDYEWFKLLIIFPNPCAAGMQQN